MRAGFDKRAGRLVCVLVGVVALSSPTLAYARGGGGSHGFSHSSGGSHSGSGGSGGSGGFGGFGGFGGSSGGSGGGSVGEVVLVLGVIAALIGLLVLGSYLARRRRDAAGANTGSDAAAHRADEQAAKRAAQVGARVDALADTDATFDRAALEERAAWLYRTAQQAWTENDLATLKRLLFPVLYGKWAEELADYASRGEVNVVEIVSGPEVELVDLANREGESNDTVTFRISATLNDYVRRADGSRAGRKDDSTTPVEYWTLRKDEGGEWLVSAVEQAAEGAHHLTAEVETDGWDQKAVAREAVLEVAGRTAVTGVADITSLTGVSWSADADAAAGDLSVLDGRFDRAVLEVAVEGFLEEWVMNDGSLDFTPVRTADRTVMRDAGIESVVVRELVSKDPVVFRVAVRATGVYYEVDRRTEEVLRGDSRERRPITLTVDLRLAPDRPDAGWTVVAASAK